MGSLRTLSYQEKMEGKLGSMSGMVREAIDNYLQKEPQENNPNARTVVRPFYSSSERCIVRSNARTIERATERRIERDYASLFFYAYIACI